MENFRNFSLLFIAMNPDKNIFTMRKKYRYRYFNSDTSYVNGAIRMLYITHFFLNILKSRMYNF